MGIARKLDMYLGDGVEDGAEKNQCMYANWVSFVRLCEANGLCTVIAHSFGTGGTGEDYYDGTDPLGENAWIYAEWDSGTGQLFGVLAQWCDAEIPGANDGAPANFDGSASGTTDGCAISMAVRDDGGSPWGGTTDNDGADTKSSPVFVPGGSSVRVFPRSNAVGGDDVLTHREMLKFGDASGSNNFDRQHFAANENGILIIHDISNDGTYQSMGLGRYSPAAHVAAVCTTPYFMLRDNAVAGWFALASTNVYGTTASSSTKQGGIVCDPADDVMTLTCSTPSSGQTSTFYQPNTLTDEFEPTPMSVLAHESGKGKGFGLAGYPDAEIFQSVYNTTTNNTNAAGDVAYLGHTSTAVRKHGFPWDGGAAPGNSFTRGGRESYTA